MKVHSHDGGRTWHQHWRTRDSFNSFRTDHLLPHEHHPNEVLLFRFHELVTKLRLRLELPWLFSREAYDEHVKEAERWSS